MKKMTTILGILALCGGSMVAAPIDNVGVSKGLTVTGVKSQYKNHLKVVAPKEALTQEVYTRQYVDKANNTYEATFQLYQKPLNEMLTFADDNGNPYNPSFDELPYYVVNYTLTMLKKGSATYSNYVNFKLAWPSQYIYDQVWNYNGEVDANGQIPESLREYQPATFDDLWNNPDRCRTFKESAGVGAGDPENGKWSYYTMLPNEMLGIGALYDGEECFTYLDNETASEIVLNSFDSSDDNFMKMSNNVWFNVNGTPRRMRCSYEGTGIVQGFIAQTTVLPEFGDMHLFNTGLVSPEIYGDNNPWPVMDFDEMTLLYCTIGDKYINYVLDPTATVFDASKISIEGLAPLPAGDTEKQHANHLTAYMFADAKYGKDINLNLSDEDSNFTQGPVESYVEPGASEDDWYALFIPKVGYMVPFMIGDNTGAMEPWSRDYGARFAVADYYEQIGNNPFNIGWGYQDGFSLHLENEFLHTYVTSSTGKLYYHYNPKNMQLFRELTLVGGLSGVEVVAAENAQILPSNGAMTIVPVEKSNVAVYSLDGICLMNTVAAAGELVTVDAPKGIYVVTVNGVARKVAL